jgi:hypothetical protein
MNELMERRAATAGTAVARAAVGTMPDFRSKEGLADKVQSTIGAKAETENSIAVSCSWRGLSTFAGAQIAPLHPRTS